MSAKPNQENSLIFTETQSDGRILFRDSEIPFTLIESTLVIMLGQGDEEAGKNVVIAIIQRLQIQGLTEAEIQKGRKNKNLTPERIRAWVHGVTIEPYGKDQWIARDPENSIGNPLSAEFLLRVGEGDLEKGKARVKAFAQNRIYHEMKEPKVVINNDLTEANVLAWVQEQHQGEPQAHYEGDFN